MSARLLKKVLKEREETEQQQFNGSEESESDSLGSSSYSFQNPFDLLDDHDQLQDNEPKIVETSTRNIDDKEPTMAKSTAEIVPSYSSKSKKNKKKKSKETSFSITYDVENLEEQSPSFEVEPSSHQSSGTSAVGVSLANLTVDGSEGKQHILQVDPKFLSAESELRRIFGSKVVNSFDNIPRAGSHRQMRGGRRGSHHHRKTVIVSPSEHWPRWDGSLSMELLEAKDGCQYFRYTHSYSYTQAQKEFEAAKAIHDLNGIAGILLHNPYHLDSLLTLAEYFKFSGEHQMSADATAKCLYALECALYPMFNLLQGNSKLKYCHETNKPIFSALFSHMKNMDRRGCHRSALEICKLLLSLDSDDPMGALLCIDYFALRAEEYAWLEWFSKVYTGDYSLWHFPNFSYSLPICRFYLENVDSKVEPGKGCSIDLMMNSLMLHPTVLKKLVAKVPLKDPAWTKILKNSFFRSDQSRNVTLDHLINIYVERSYLLWRLPDLQKFLKDSALLAVETWERDASYAENMACAKLGTFSPDKNEYAHLAVSDFSDSVPTMPPEDLQNFMIDPRMREMGHGDPLPGGERVPHDVANRNVLAVLFESLLPWVSYGTVDGGNDQQDAPEERQD